jgi:hypothetical protein
MTISDKNDEECDATGDDRSNTADIINKKLHAKSYFKEEKQYDQTKV